MYAIRKVGTEELMTKDIKHGFYAADKPEDVQLWRRRQDAEYRRVNCMGRKEMVCESGEWVLRFVPYSWVKQIELEVVEVEIVLNVRNS